MMDNCTLNLNVIEKIVYELELRHECLLELYDSERGKHLNSKILSEIEFVEGELDHYKKLLRR